MPRIKNLALSAALLSVAFASTAEAKSTRSSASVPAVSHQSHRDLPSHVGPKKGFADNHGIRQAMEHSNEHSAHHRDHDSPGY